MLGVLVASGDGGRRLGVRYGLGRAGALVELRLALPLRAVGPEGFAAVARYVADPDRRDELAAQVDQGMLHVAGDGSITATARGQSYLADLFTLHSEIAGQVLTARAGALEALTDLAGRMLEAATASGGAAFSTQYPPWEPPGAGSALLLFNRLAALRYHRADAHAAAWAAAGHSVASIRALDGLARDAVEAETNRRAAPPLAALDDGEQTAFLAGLAGLATPRP